MNKIDFLKNTSLRTNKILLALLTICCVVCQPIRSFIIPLGNFGQPRDWLNLPQVEWGI